MAGFSPGKRLFNYTDVRHKHLNYYEQVVGGNGLSKVKSLICQNPPHGWQLPLASAQLSASPEILSRR